VSGPHPAVAAVRSAVRTALAEAEPGDVVLAACSGGADSWALAAALAFEAPRLAVRAGAVVVDHGLQPGTAARSADLGDRLRAAGLEPVRVVAVDVGRVGGPEAAARTARYAALDAVATEERAALVLLGHTRDDQAETVLLGLARGSGARSLAGMPRASGRYRRPLLALPRATTHDACEALGILTWADPHNDDPAYARVRVRQAALPALERSLGPGVAAALARSADLLRDDAAALDAWAAEAEASATDPDGGLAVDVLRALPTAVRRRVLRRAALAAGCPPGTLAAVHVDAVDALLTLATRP
jgi:tRNA(Ile)-lysidine synthase